MNGFYRQFKVYFLLIALFQGCTGPRDKTDLPEHLEDLQELTIHSGGEQPLAEIDFHEVHVYGDTEDVIIGDLWAFDVDENGQVYIADSQKMKVKMFDPEGDALGTIGKEGDGPGEFREISGIQTTAGYLFVLDRNRQQIFTFNTETGEYVREIGIAGNRGDFEAVRDAHLNHFFVWNEDEFLFEFSKSRVPENAEAWDYFSGTRLLYHLDREGNIVSDKLLETKSSYQVLVPMAGRVIGTPVDFYGKPLIQVTSDGGIYVAWSEEFLIKRYSPDGEYQRAFYHPVERAEFLPEHSFDGADEAFLETAKQSMDFPSQQPALNDLLADDENRLWVSTIVEDYDVYEWWVLKKTGELITRFEWPRDEPIEVVKNGYMYTRQTDEETGLQQVVRYKIEFCESG